MKKRFYLSLGALLITALQLTAQDFTFSQFYEQPLLRNPALAGFFNGDIRVAMAHRDQWGSVTVPFRTTSLSIEHKIPMANYHDVLTIGAQMSMDGAGDIRLKRTQLMPAIAFHKSLDGEKDTYLSIAFMGGPVSSQFDITQLKFGDQYTGGSYNPSNPSMQPITNNSYSYWDLGTGLAFSTVLNNQARFYVAAGLAHFTKPTINSVTTADASFLAPKLSFNMGLHGKVGERAHLIAFADYYTQGGNRQMLGGLMYGLSATQFEDEEATVIYFGSFLRYGDAVIPVVKLEFSKMTIGVSYDINVSKLRTVSNWRGGLELTAAYKGFLKIRNSTLDKLRCVRF
jgi:type IX secretion system PorP/SprF family membrane protein